MAKRAQITDDLPASEAGDATLESDRGATDTGRPASESEVPADDEQGDATQSWPGRNFGSIPPPG